MISCSFFFANCKSRQSTTSTEFSYVTLNISWAPELRREVDFINFMDLEMSRGDKAITLLSGDGGGVIKPIAGDDEEVV